jgi:hypothetical protein
MDVLDLPRYRLSDPIKTNAIRALEQSRRAIVIEDVNGNRIKKKRTDRRHTYTYMEHGYYSDFVDDILSLRKIEGVLEERRVSMQKDLINNTAHMIRDYELSQKEKKKHTLQKHIQKSLTRSRSADVSRSPLIQSILETARATHIKPFKAAASVQQMLTPKETNASLPPANESSLAESVPSVDPIRHSSFESISTEEKLQRVRMNRLANATEMERTNEERKHARTEARRLANEDKSVLLHDGLLKIEGFITAVKFAK